MEKVDILGTKVSKATTQDVLDDIEKVLDSQKKLFIVTANPEGIIQAENNKEFQNIVNSANIITADGIGVLWAARFLSYKNSKTIFRFLEIPLLAFFSLLAIIFYRSHIKKVLPERVTGADLFWEIIHKAYEEDKSIFLLGGNEGVADKIKNKLQKLLPDVKISGAYSGFPQEKGLVEKINETNPDILFVAWGQPKQEKWIYKNLHKLNAKVLIGVGGTFDVVAGKIKRAPVWIQKIGLEWLWRLFKEPKRIGRILTAVPNFIFTVISYKIKNS